MSKTQTMRDQGTKVTLKGKEMEVKFDLNALCNLQDEFGDIDKAFDGVSNKDFKKIRTLLHIGLANGENIDITVSEVGALIDMENLHDIIDALGASFGKAMPEAGEVSLEKGN